MSIDKAIIEYREHQLSKVKEVDIYERNIQIRSNVGKTNQFNINQGEYNAIEGILLHPLAPSPSLDKMDAYELFMNLQMWSLETLRGWLMANYRNGEYLDDIANGFVLTREYAINTIFKFIILDNQ